MLHKLKNCQKCSAFTIVELLIVIVVIGILVAIIIVSYAGITRRAKVASIQSDLGNGSKQLTLFKIDNINDSYPDTIDCDQPDSSINKCIKVSGDNTIELYQADNLANPKTYTLIISNGGINHRITSDSKGVEVGLVCPHNFIVVPGSSTYGTNDFCVMKYEARQASLNVPISRASELPWVNISQNDAITYSANVTECIGCHLITDAQWLTIAQNVLSVGGNWSSGTVGSGYIPRGHSDNNPANAITADTSDSNGYVNTGNVGDEQKRTLTLTNGEVIWDFAGNVGEWVSTIVTGGQPGIVGGGYQWRNWTAMTTHGTLSPDPFPVTTGLSGAESWNSTNGIGMSYTNADDANPRSVRRGGAWPHFGGAGVLSLYTIDAPGAAGDAIGFRVAR